MKKGTKIALIIIVILIAIVASIAVMVVKDVNQEESLNNELSSLYELLGNYPLNYDELDTKLSQIVTTGDYEQVEKSVKEYSSSFVNSIKQLDALFNDENIINALTPANMKEDGPDFTQTKKSLNNAKSSLEKLSSDIASYFTEETAISYIQNKELDDYYVNLYKQYVIGENPSDMENVKEEITSSLNEFKAFINKEQEIIDFLVNNKRSWKIENDQLVFYSNSLANTYNKLISEL